jgi:U1 snRNP component, mediates U1 snRNP association with cap-binding complex
MDLGECPKIHDLALRADYEKASKNRDYYYDIDVSIESFIYLLLLNVSFINEDLFFTKHELSIGGQRL